jgi:signal transduction histidine kinase
VLLIGDNLAARIVAILLGSVLALALLVAAVLLWPRGNFEANGLFQLPAPEETARIVQAVEASPPLARPLVLRALNSDAATVRVEPRMQPLAAGLHRSPGTEWVLARYSRLLGSRPLRAELRTGLLRQLLSPRPSVAIRLSIGLNDGSVLVIERRPPALIRNYIARAAAFVALASAILGGGLVLAVRQTAGPVARLAAAARRFSIDGRGPDLPLQGARELRDLSAAFNEMQYRIRALVDDRTRVLAAIAHDLRTYLTRLRLRADFIGDDDQRSRAARDIEEMSLLIDDTLMFAEQAAAPILYDGRVDVAEEVAKLVALRQELGEPVSMDEAATEAGLAVRCAPLMLRRMLANLTDNAIRYGGSARIGFCSAGETVDIFVNDEGPGVPADDLARMVRPFERLERSRGRQTGGAGLGLAIVRALVESNGGALNLINRQPAGLSAILRLPRVQPDGL